MSECDMVVIGASAGGVEALKQVAMDLPAGFSSPICIVLHVSPNFPSLLPEILSKVGKIPSVHAQDGDRIEPGHIYIAPPDHHLLIESGRLVLSRGPKENRHRPAIDPLFRSAALLYGPRAVGVLLSGNGDDGSAGMIAIKRAGGTTIVQDPDDATYASMPRNALIYDNVDHCLPLEKLTQLLIQKCEKGATQEPNGREIRNVRKEVQVSEMNSSSPDTVASLGKPSGYSCPECDGPLYEIREGKLVRFRCDVGHAFSPDSLNEAQCDAVETALWSAVQALDQQAKIRTKLAEQARHLGQKDALSYYAERAHESKQQADALRQILKSGVERK